MDEARLAVFWQRTAQFEDGCIEFQGSRNGKGYGYFSIGGKTVAAHRLAWTVAHGEIPAGLVVMHRCDNPPCVNVEHLELGTNDANMNDWKFKGRPRRGNVRERVMECESSVVKRHARGFIGPKLKRGDFIIE